MKNVLCFGDSNTWGYVPGTDGERYPFHLRWPGVATAQLGKDYYLVECGLPGRTTVFDDPTAPDRCGRRQLPSILDTHAPLDLVVIMLGTNDLKNHLGLDAGDVATGAGTLVRMIQTGNAGQDGQPPKVLLVAPPTATERAPQVCGHAFLHAVEKSLGFPEAFSVVATQLGCAYFDAATVAMADPGDGLHLDAIAHRNLGRALADCIRRLLPVDP